MYTLFPKTYLLISYITILYTAKKDKSLLMELWPYACLFIRNESPMLLIRFVFRLTDKGCFGLFSKIFKIMTLTHP